MAVVQLPERPKLIECPEPVVITGKIVTDENGVRHIILVYEDAERLHQFMNAYYECAEENQVRLQGYAEKLENRLKAVGGK